SLPGTSDWLPGTPDWPPGTPDWLPGTPGVPAWGTTWASRYASPRGRPPTAASSTTEADRSPGRRRAVASLQGPAPLSSTNRRRTGTAAGPSSPAPLRPTVTRAG